MAEASGSFVTRSFERMLKDSTGKKYSNLHKALKAYLERSKSVERPSSPSSNAHIEKPDEFSVTDSSLSEVEQSSIESKEISSTPTSPTSSKSPSDAASNLNIGASAAATMSMAGHTLEQSEAELVLLPLRLAFETKQPKLVESALDCLHKLISYEHLEGDAGLEGGKNSAMVTDMFNMVCAAADNNAPDSTILQVLKVLLIAVASTKFRVHGECLLSSIRTCYHIVLTSKNSINQATAKATLTQMISIVFKRMELESQEQDQADTGQRKNLRTKGQGEDVDSVVNTVNDGENLVTADTALETHPVQPPESSVPEAVPVSVEELQHLAGDADIKGLEAALVKAVHPDGGRKVPEGLDLESMTLVQRDGLMVFRTLCKMSMKEENDDFVNRTRILSLELLQGLLESVSHSFTVDFHFIDSVKAYLCYALLRACVSSTTLIFQLACGIFSVLLLRFRESLKSEIGVFFPLIVLRSLDSSDSPLNQRTAVLRILENGCKDSQMLADVFVNYDCDLEATNLFERMVRALSRMAQGSPNADPNNIALAQNAAVKASALKCLVSILNSLVQWTRKHQDTRQIVMNSIAPSEGKQLGSTSGEDSLEGYGAQDIDGGEADQFEKVKAHKSTLQAAIAEFNRKPDKGIEYLAASKLVENEPTSVAKFLLSTPGLDKSIVGEYLGQHEEFPLAVMHAYVDAMNFKGMKFDLSIREFLKGFRLPGEAQKIDRIMEKFAERYCRDNPGLFESADAAYVLAYAVIMLNTDAHNPMVWPKMTKADFIRINSGNELDNAAPQKELLEEIYDSIVKDEIKMKDDFSLSGKGTFQKFETEDRSRLVSILNLGLPRRKASVDAKKESEDIIKRTQALFKKGVVKRGVFYKAKQIELVRPMLEAMGWPLLVAFSVTLEDSDNKSQVLLCMEGFRAGIHLAKVLGMDTMRYAFLTSLVRFTFLHAPKEMRSKNVEALRTLLALCESESDALQDTWNAILECISRLEYITSSPSILITLMIGSNQVSRDMLSQSLTELTGKPTEQVFVNSVKLPSDAIVEFFTALCGVSAEELKQTPPRVFSLQKLVEISYYNMARIRMVWARIWLVLSQHFVSAGSHPDEQIAMYAIDSLRQLGIKYLERAELTNFTFQNDILKPFVVLIRSSSSPRIRALIVDCIVQMIKSKVGSIKSGWRSVFMVFKAAASDKTESIAEIAFENMEQVVLEHFDQVVGDCFMDCVHCLIAFANNKSCPRISLKSIALLRICEDRLAEGFIPGGASKPIEIDIVGEDFDVAEHYWFPMLVGLSELTADPRTEVRNCALEVLFDLLKERGNKFSPSFWENVFRDVLFPIFDYVRNAGKDMQKSASADVWLRETCIHSLQLLCNLFSTFYKEVSFLLPSLLSLLLDCATKPDQALALISIDALTHLMKVGGHQFDKKDWATILDSLRDACYTTQPVELFNLPNVGDYRLRYSEKFSSSRDDRLTSGHTLNDGVSDGEVLDTYENGYSSAGTPHTVTNGGARHIHGSEPWDLEMQERLDPGDMEATAEGKESSGGFFRNQTLGRTFMDTILLKNLTFKGKGQTADTSSLSSSEQGADISSHDVPAGEEEIVFPPGVRSKCLTQLLFLGALDSLQTKHWTRLDPTHKVLIMDVLLSMVDFAASYNSYKNLQIRMRQFSGDRPPLNLLRQEIEGTRIYLKILNRTLTEYKPMSQQKALSNGSHSPVMNEVDDAEGFAKGEEQTVREAAEQRIVSFCGYILKEASYLQPGMGDALETDAHMSLTLRSPVVVKVLNGMSKMESDVFKKHLGQFYSYFTKLICSEQVEVRRALGDLFKAQLISILP